MLSPNIDKRHVYPWEGGREGDGGGEGERARGREGEREQRGEG